MKKTLAIKGSELPKEMKKKLHSLVRSSFYFIKGFKIDDVPLQLTHFYKGYLRFKIIAWPSEDKEEHLSPYYSCFSIISSKKERIRMSRIKMSHAPLEKIPHSESRTNKFKTIKKNNTTLSNAKGYINLWYSTLKKAPYITFENILKEDLPLFIGNSKNWTHFKDILGFISNTKKGDV